MILVDTSIWVDHFKSGDPLLVRLLEDDSVLIHRWVVGELALGVWRERAAIFAGLAALPRAAEASDGEILALIERRTLFGVGIGYVDAGLLASTILTVGSTLWTRDKRLLAAAETLGIAARTAH